MFDVAIIILSAHICDILFTDMAICTPLVHLQKSVLAKQFYH